MAIEFTECLVGSELRSHLIFQASVIGRAYHTHLADEETEALKTPLG